MGKRIMAHKTRRVKRRKTKHQVFGRVRRVAAESKYIDVTINQTVSTTSVVSAISLMALGTDDFQHIGNMIDYKYLQFRLWFNQTPPAVNVRSDCVRVCIVFDRQTNGTAPVFATVLQDVDNAGANTSNTFSFPNRDTKHRFLILYDKYFYVPPVSTAVIGNQSSADGRGTVLVHKFIKLRGLIQRFIDNTAAVSSVESGSLYILHQSNTVVAGTSATTLQGTLRVCYNDK